MRKCFYCGCEDRELRPYGPNDSLVCFDCVDGDPERNEIARRSFLEKLDSSIKKTGAAFLTEEGPIPYIGKIR